MRAVFAYILVPCYHACFFAHISHVFVVNHMICYMHVQAAVRVDSVLTEFHKPL